MKRPTSVSFIRSAAFAGILAAATSTAMLADESLLSDNWNTAGCGMTDTVELDLTSPVHLRRVDIWYNWSADETSVSYTLMSGDQKVTGGSLSRGDCDPNQASWCIARGTPAVDLAAGHYTIQVERAGVCQNGGSNGKGFLKAYGEPANGSVETRASNAASGSSGGMESASAASNASDVPTDIAVKIAAVTVLGSVLISFGAAVASGLSGLGNGASPLSDAIAGNIPSDGFEDWKQKTESTGKVYGTGSADDPYRDFPDADNPSWKPHYGDGSVANPYSDTAPPVIDRPVDQGGSASGDEETPQVFHTKVETKGVQAANAEDTAVLVTHEEPVPISDKFEKVEPIPDPPPDFNVQMGHLENALMAAVGELQHEGKYVANGTYFEKIMNGLPHLEESAIDWLSSTVGYPTHLTEEGWGQCGEAAEWGVDKLHGPVREIFGNDAVFTQIVINSRINPLGNHIANEVILPTGERYVIDMWQSMKDGKPAICPEDEWLAKWSKESSILGLTYTERGGGTSPYESALEKSILSDGVEEGIKKFRQAYDPQGTNAQVATIIRSYQTHPWDIRVPAMHAAEYPTIVPSMKM